MPSICEARKDALFYGCYKGGRVTVVIGIPVGSHRHPGRNGGTHFHVIDIQRGGTAHNGLVAEGYVYCLPGVCSEADAALRHVVPARQQVGVAIEFDVCAGIGTVGVGTHHHAIDA